MKKIIPMVVFMAFFTPAEYVFADGADPVLPVDSRIVVLTYDESDVYTIVTKYGYQTNLVFGEGEEVETISMGDRTQWQIIPAGQRLFIRPLDDNVITNMTILTNKHAYQFDLKSLSDDSKDKPLYVVKFRYPDEKRKKRSYEYELPVTEPAAAQSFTPLPQSRPATISPVKLSNEPSFSHQGFNYNYTFSGSDTLAPIKVFDDGKSTYIKYKTMTNPLPKAFIKDSTGSERKVDYYMKDTQIVIDEVVGQILLKHSGGDIVIYNEMLNPK